MHKKILLFSLTLSLLLLGTLFPKNTNAETFTCAWSTNQTRCVVKGSECNCPGGCNAANIYTQCTSRSQSNCGSTLQCPGSTDDNTSTLDSSITNPNLACTIGGLAGLKTAIGCIPIQNTTSLQGAIVKWGTGIAGGIGVVMIIIASYQMMTSQGDPGRLQGAKELLYAAIGGITLLIFAALLIRIIGVDLLKILPES